MRMNLRADVLEVDPHAILPDETPEITFISDIKAKPASHRR
jgi:hypothetical protein